MKMLLNEYKAEFHTRVLDLLWRQWVSLGVTGYGKAWTQSIIDPDALLLVSCTVARHDPRLFDAMMDWMGLNGSWMNVNRINRMLMGVPYAGGAVFAAVAASIRDSGNTLKWSRSASVREEKQKTGEPLFYLADGSPLPVAGEPDPVFKRHGFLRDRYCAREVASAFRPELPANLLMRLRAFLGVNARCEILAYLLLNGRGSPRAVARASGYYPATVNKALSEMGASGYLVSRVEGRHRFYFMNTEALGAAILEGTALGWVNWIPLLGAFEQIWMFLHEPGRERQSPLAQASDLRRLLNASIMKKFSDSGLAEPMGDHTRYAGESLIPFFISQTRQILDRCFSPRSAG